MLTAPVADALLVAAWLTVAADGLVLLRRERRARAALGPPIAGRRTPPRACALGLLVAVLGGAVLLERTTGRLPFHAGTAALGIALAGIGAGLHMRARRALGALWSGAVTVRADQPIVDRGPYARIRHPIYAAFLLLAAGTLLTHPSPATLCLAAGCTLGLGVKIGVEERALRAALGDRYVRYAARVPALVPRVRPPR